MTPLRDLITLLLLLFCLFLLGAIPLAFMDRASCYASWDPSFQPKWTVAGGCTIVADGRRIPSSALHQINPK